jgi:hypothetical protein
MGRRLLGARRLQHGGRRHGGRRRGGFFRRDRIRYAGLSARTKPRLPPLSRGEPERRSAIHAVDRAMLRPPPSPCAARAPRPQRGAPAAEDHDLRATHATPKSSVHRSATLSRRGWTPGAFDGTVIHGGRVVRCARHEGSGVQTRAFTLLRPAHLTSSTPLRVTTMPKDQFPGSSSESRGTRRAPTPGRRARAGSRPRLGRAHELVAEPAWFPTQGRAVDDNVPRPYGLEPRLDTAPTRRNL